MKHRHRWGRILPLFFMLAFVLAGCEPSALNPVGKVADMQASLMMLSLGVMLLVIVAVMVIFVYVLIRYRRRKGEKERIPHQVEGNMKLELTWTVIPILLLFIIAVPTVSQTFKLSDTSPEASTDKNVVNVNVTAHQYWWEFGYPDQDLKTASDLYVPTGSRVHVTLTSDDVVHSFWVPSLFGKKDANPGLENEMWFEVDEPGVYRGKCAELCGPSHAFMDFKVVAVSPDKFEKWQKNMKAGAVKPQTASAKQGQQIFKDQCMSCHAIGDKGGTSAYPDLTGFGNRQQVAGILEYNKKNLKDWIHDAPSIKEDIEMPSFKDSLSDKQVDALADYLMGQKTNIKVSK